MPPPYPNSTAPHSDPGHHLLLLGSCQNLPTGPLICLHSSQDNWIRTQITQHSLRGQAELAPRVLLPSYLPAFCASSHRGSLFSLNRDKCSLSISSLYLDHSPGPSDALSAHTALSGAFLPSLTALVPAQLCPSLRHCALYLCSLHGLSTTRHVHVSICFSAISAPNKGSSLRMGALALPVDPQHLNRAWHMEGAQRSVE